jgi:hypothetical protein
VALGLAACSGQSGQGVTPAAQGAGTLKPLDTFGGTTLHGKANYSMCDSSPSLDGKSVAHFYIGVDSVNGLVNGIAQPLLSFTSPYVIDLLQYQNGASLAMGEVTVPALNYGQFQLVLNEASTQIVFSDGSTMPVSWKLGHASASSAHAADGTTATNDPNLAGAVDVTVNTPFTIAADAITGLTADFNVLESLKLHHNRIEIRPSLFVTTGASGQITGTIDNKQGAPVANAVVVATGSHGEVANTSATDANGNFNLHALGAGTYHLKIYNSYTTAAGQNEAASGQSSNSSWVDGPTVTVTAGGSVSTGTLND